MHAGEAPLAALEGPLGRLGLVQDPLAPDPGRVALPARVSRAQPGAGDLFSGGWHRPKPLWGAEQSRKMPAYLFMSLPSGPEVLRVTTYSKKNETYTVLGLFLKKG